MDSEQIERHLTEVREHLNSADVTVFEPDNLPYESFTYTEDEPLEFVERGLSLGVDCFYVLDDWNEAGEQNLGGITYFHRERAHTLYLLPDDRQRESGATVGEHGREGSQRLDYGREESEAERERKEELRKTLLGEYREHLSEDEEFELENRLERVSLRRLLTLRDRAETEAKRDPEEETRLAKVVYNDDRFNRQFNEMDTEMLLDSLDVEFDPETVRVEEVHRRAKSLLKINR